MTGYQEVLTDPSYRGQIVAMTYPHIGNYGTNALDQESAAAARARFCHRGIDRRARAIGVRSNRSSLTFATGRSPASRESTPAR